MWREEEVFLPTSFHGGAENYRSWLALIISFQEMAGAARAEYNTVTDLRRTSLSKNKAFFETNY